MEGQEKKTESGKNWIKRKDSDSGGGRQTKGTLRKRVYKKVELGERANNTISGAKKGG